MGATVSSAYNYSKLYLPDRDSLVRMGLLEERQTGTSQNKKARRLKRLFREMKELLKKMKINDIDMQAYYDAYTDCDLDSTSLVTYTNFCEALRVIPCPFVDAMFFNFDATKTLTFPEFLVVTYYFCAPGARALAKHIFAVYDQRRMGRIHEMVVDQIVREIYTKTFRLEPGATRAIVNLINCKDKEYRMVTEEQFVEIIFENIQPARQMQTDLKGRMMDFIFWWRVVKNGAPTSTITFREALNMAQAINARMDEEDRIAALKIKYRARGGQWEDGNDEPPPSVAEKERFDTLGNALPTGDAGAPGSPAPLSPGQVAFHTTPGQLPARRRIRPQGRVMLLPQRPQKKTKVPGTGGGSSSKLLPGEDTSMVLESGASPSRHQEYNETRIFPEVVRPSPDVVRVWDKRVPAPLSAATLGKGGFDNSKRAIENYESMTQGRDLHDMIKQLGID